jgi:flagellar hook protein FlgE
MAGFDSLYTGITGLNAYQSWIDMISNNIANVDTTGFKGQMMTFADLFYQNQSYASAPTNTSGGIDGQQLGYGTKVNTVDTLFGQGGLQTTGANTDMAINGDGFFILNNLQGNAIPTYTRDGHFQLNANGVLVDPATGLAVQGYEANSSGQVQYGATGNITVPLGLTMQATATGAGTKVGPTGDSVFDVAMGGNLDQTQWQQSFLNSVGASATNGAPFTVTTTMYDSLGNSHQIELTYIPDTTGAVAATGVTTDAGGDLTAAATVAAANPTAGTINIKSNGPGAGTYTVTDVNGNATTYAAGTQVTVDGATFTLSSPATATGTAATVVLTAAVNGLPASVDNASGTGETPATRWRVVATSTDGTVFQTIAKAGSVSGGGVVTGPSFGSGTTGTIGYVYFNQNGQFINSSSIESVAAGQSLGAAAKAYLHTAGSTPSLNQGNEFSVSAWGGGVNNQASSAPPGTIAMGYWQDNSLAGSYTANVVSQNGFASGTLATFSVGADGTVTGAFTNGQQKTLAQLALARFQNEDGLQRVGGNQFEQTANSGLAQVGVAGTGVLGSIQDGALEQSNVSLSTEFTNLIVAQRAFEANTRGITTADQNLQTVINLRASEN